MALCNATFYSTVVHPTVTYYLYLTLDFPRNRFDLIVVNVGEAVLCVVARSGLVTDSIMLQACAAETR